MTKILLVGDIHMMDKAPSGRTETYPDDIIAKLEWLANFAREQEVDATVWAGDVFHFKQPSRTSHATVLRMIEVVRKFRGKLWIVTGNHDISNDVVQSVHEKQPLGVLLKSGAKELDGWHDTLPIFGVPWQQRWMEEGTVDEAFAEWRAVKGDGPFLAITHAPIIPPALNNGLFETLNVDEIAKAMVHQDYLYYGHIHEDHGIWTHGGVTFANMGAISRGSLHEYNLTRKVKAALWTPEDGFSEVFIPHKPAEEVFRIAEAQNAKQEKKNLDSFLEEVGSSTLDISSTESVIEHIRQMNIESRVKKTAIEILEEVS